MNEFELRLAQIAVAFVVAIFTLPAVVKVWWEVKQLTRARRRAEAEFLLKVDEKVNDPNLKRHALELTYAALTGDHQLTHAQRVFLVSLEESEIVIQTFGQVQRLLGIDTDAKKFVWKRPRNANPGWRNFVKVFGYCGYVALGFFAFAPAIYLSLLPDGSSTGKAGVIFQVVWAAYFIWVALQCLRGAMRVSIAEKLIASTLQKQRQPDGGRLGPTLVVPSSTDDEASG